MSRLSIKTIDSNPIEYIEYFTIPHGALTAQKFQLPIYRGEIEGLPQSIDSIVVTSDLQGVCNFDNDQTLLLGEVLAESLALIYEIYFPQLKLEKSWAFLCGDLYANLEKRGSSGNPINVWQAFAQVFRQVIGIAGNHDDFGKDLYQLAEFENIHFLDNDFIEINHLKIAGLSGIIGRVDKNFRLPEDEYYSSLKKLLKKQPDILLTHLSPHIQEMNFLGEPQLLHLLEKYAENLLFCGHSHWDTSQVVTLKNNTQILNADSKVFILINKNRNNEK
ncbi:metallophosphoesterase [Acinetobacter sichuanensis]|uniref:metallophosphoesterase family protein n=1 Tax=Acinetobacter sichuanensis TaxID=2136183 RepID=UPI00280E77AB|nr:metallophosphoesterase [Acinetobacter sichuanensis]MDQ9021150.1 metallophosphoesterase [Acinetobacter sichuanensis]